MSDVPEHRFSPAGLSIDVAEALGSALQESLSTLIDLGLSLKHAHWNVTGPGFIAIHEMLDAHLEAVRPMIDEVAERITTLGGVPAGLASQVVENRAGEGDYALGRAEVSAHLGALDKLYETVCLSHRRAIDEVADSDPVTEDVLIGQLRGLELQHWLVRAHLQDTAGRLITMDDETQLDAAVSAALNQGDDLADVELLEETARS